MLALLFMLCLNFCSGQPPTLTRTVGTAIVGWYGAPFGPDDFRASMSAKGWPLGSSEARNYTCWRKAPSEEEWDDEARDDDATTDPPGERRRQQQVAITSLLEGHRNLRASPTTVEINKGLMSS